MLVELPRLIFKAAIERLSVLSESGKVKVDAYTHIRLETLPGGLLFSAYNRTMQAEILITEVRHPGVPWVCGVPLQQLKDLCATLPPVDLLALEFQQSSCTVLCGPVRFKTKVLLEDAFPRVPPGATELRPVNLQLLFQAMSLVQHCVDTSSQRPYAHGILVTKASICATDGMRLAKVPDKWLQPDRPIAMTMETVTRLQKLFKGYSEGGILLRDGEIILSGGGVRAIARLAAWKAPNVEQVLPKTSVTPIEIDKGQLAQALERALIVANENAPQTTLRFSESGIQIYTEEDGQVSDDVIPVPVTTRGAVTLNPQYLLDAVKSIESESVFLELRGPEVPLIVTGKGGDHVNVIMPMQSADGQ